MKTVIFFKKLSRGEICGPTLKLELKKKLLSASARALKLCSSWTNENTSCDRLHTINKRATPIKMSLYN